MLKEKYQDFEKGELKADLFKDFITKVSIF
jgi:hypothetical protein